MRKNKNNKIYVVLLIICFIALGYSLISSRLNINGSAGDLTLNGGTFTSPYYAVYIYSGNYTYTGGNINGPFLDNRQL